MKSLYTKDGKDRRNKRAGIPSKPSPTAFDTPAAAPPCVGSSFSGSPACWLTSGGLWDPEGRSGRTRWDCPLCHNHTSLRTRTSQSPDAGKEAKTEFGGFPDDGSVLDLEGADLWRFPVRDDAVHLHLDPELQVL